MLQRALVVLALFVSSIALAQPSPGPYVTVYRDDAVAFQVRRDRIKQHDGLHTVWLRWLWAEPQPWKEQWETARMIVADVDCADLRVRELAVLHRDRAGKIFDSEEVTSAEEAPWKRFEEKSGARAAITRLCEFLPKLVAAP